MKKNLPFEDTEVSIRKSQFETKELLYSIGFSRIAELTDSSGNSIIIAEVGDGNKRASFRFEANVEKVYEKIYEKRQYSWEKNKIRAQSERIAWRIIYHHVKVVHDLIRHGVLEIVDAFAANLLLTDKNGNQVKAGDFLKQGIVAGSLSSTSMTDRFLLEEK